MTERYMGRSKEEIAAALVFYDRYSPATAPGVKRDFIAEAEAILEPGNIQPITIQQVSLLTEVIKGLLEEIHNLKYAPKEVSINSYMSKNVDVYLIQDGYQIKITGRLTGINEITPK